MLLIATSQSVFWKKRGGECVLDSNHFPQNLSREKLRSSTHRERISTPVLFLICANQTSMPSQVDLGGLRCSCVAIKRYQEAIATVIISGYLNSNEYQWKLDTEDQSKSTKWYSGAGPEERKGNEGCGKDSLRVHCGIMLCSPLSFIPLLPPRSKAQMCSKPRIQIMNKTPVILVTFFLCSLRGVLTSATLSRLSNSIFRMQCGHKMQPSPPISFQSN